jgi:hypothetical protein
MAKKQFSSGIERLFLDDDGRDETVGGISEVSVRTRTERKSTGTKSFAHDLDALLQEALEDSLNRYDAETQRVPQALKSKAAQVTGPSSSGGLDMLIRNTIDIQELERDVQTGTSRLTVAVDRTKLDQLKTIARRENAHVKSLLTGLIDEYIKQYMQEKGISS